MNTPRPSRIYFLTTVDRSMVKIGTARDPSVRLKALRGASPVDIVLAATTLGSYEAEKALHFALWSHHSHCEWFRGHPDVIAVVDFVAINDALPPEIQRAIGQKTPKFKWGPWSRTKMAA